MNSKNNNNNPQTNPFFQMENEVLEFWEKNKIFEKSVQKEAPKGDYVFYDGPPFITGLPHYATILPSMVKDLIPRFKTMHGYRVERDWGWDCHGLPAENKVEKELGLKNKKDIETFGIDKFVGACRDYVSTCSSQWKWYIDHIARWVDMDSAYKTMDIDFMESVMWSFKELYNKGLIYEGYRSSLHCPRCATPLSKFEITMDEGSYKDVSDETVVVKFKLKNPEKLNLDPKDNTYILAWTTTPWTLPGNLALAVGEDIDYVKIKDKWQDEKGKELKDFEAPYSKSITEYYILEKKYFENNKNKFHNHQSEIIDEFKGKDLVGLEYEPIFDLQNKTISENENVYQVYAGDFVSTEEGTGVVHIAPNFGEDDFNLGKKYNLPIIELMDENGIYTKEAGADWEGLYFKKANKIALEKLGGKIFASFKYTHSYPHCYRCSTPLIYKSQKAWYLSIEKIRQKLLETNSQINWYPDYFKDGRFKYNLENAPDWCLSRSRYWGSPIPVWKCSCGEIKVLGSIQEIEELSGEKISDLHRPEIDKPQIPCPKCGQKMTRVLDVFDCWFESGAMTFAQFHYPFSNHRNKVHPVRTAQEGAFVADIIVEYTGQLRGWFYYLLVLSNVLFNTTAFKNVLVTGVLAGTDGRKMSKSFGNYPDPKITLEKYGADALRMYFVGSPILVGSDMALSEKDIQESLRKNIMILWNVYKFYEMFSTNYQFSINNVQLEGKNILDQINVGTRRGVFLQNELSQSKNILDQWILIRLDELTKEITDKMEKYDLPSASRPITGFIDDLSTWYIRRSRDRFKGEDEEDKKNAIETTGYVLLTLSKLIAPFMPFMAERLWQVVSGYNFSNPEKSVHLESWPDNQSSIINLQSSIIEDMNLVRKIVELGLAKRDEFSIKIRQPLNKFKIQNSKFKIDDEYLNLIKDELNVKNVVIEKGEGELKVELDTSLTPELIADGLKRELVRSINNLRKSAGLTIADKIYLYYKSEKEEIKNAFTAYQEEIKKDCLISEIYDYPADDLETKQELKVNQYEIVLGIKKI